MVRVNVSKWFHVLVVGGASLLSTGCTPSDDTSKESGAKGSPDMDAVSMDSSKPDPHGTGDTSGSMDAAALRDAGAADATFFLDVAPADVSFVHEAGGADMALGADAQSDAAALQCSTPAAPGDPCGCPCCWATTFLNTDPECAGFCVAGNGGAGCCGD